MKVDRRVGLLLFIYCLVRRENIVMDGESLWMALTFFMWVGYFIFWAPWDRDEQERA